MPSRTPRYPRVHSAGAAAWRALGGRGVVVGGLLVTLCPGCGSRRAEDVSIVPALSAEPRAQQELRALEQAWEASGAAERAGLAPRIAEHVRRFPDDPGTSRARVLLAWLLLDAGELDRADAVLAPALAAPEGATRDHARLVHAASLTRRGEPGQALSVLEPLHGKLVGHEVTHLYGRERARAALEARRWRQLVAALTQWIDDSAEAQQRVRRSAQRSLAQVPSHALIRLLEEHTSSTAPRRGSGAWMERALTEQIARSVLERRDARLARQLADVAPSWFRATPEGQQVALLARRAAREARVEGRTLGVVMEEEDPAARRRSAQVLAGVVEALGMGRGDREAAVRLVVRENQDGMAATLSALASEGASVLVGGVDESGARVALAFAEERKVPVMVLVAPVERPVELSYGFVLGAPRAPERTLLEAALAERGVESPKLIGEEGVSCQARPAYPGAPRFPVASWVKEGSGGALVLADSVCAKRLASEARGSRKGFVLGLGLEASQILFESAPGSVGLGAGSFPHAAAPSAAWFELLGRDAARLARAALSVVPEDTEADGDAVRVHVERARDALRSARAPLETTAASGFAGGQTLERELRVIDAPAAPTKSKPASQP